MRLVMVFRLVALFAAAALAIAAAVPARAGDILDRVKAAGSLSCGVLYEPEDWNKDDVHAALPGLGSDICRAVAAAVLGSPDKVRIIPIPSEQLGFKALQSGKADLVMGATPSGAASILYGVAFVRPVFFDGHALLVHQDAGIKTFADLAHRTVCFSPATMSEEVLDAEADRRHVAVMRWPFEENGEMLAAIAGRKCDALFGSASRLAVSRTAFHARADDFVLLPERYSVVPMAPAVPGGDAAWAETVDAVAGAPVLAESGGVDRAHAESLRHTEDPLLRGLGGLLPGIDASVVDAGWGVRVIGVLGNAAELYDRDLGSGSELALPRGANALWTQGGLMVPEPLPH